MKTKIFFLMMLVLVIVSCDKDNNNIGASINGNYIGTFERSGSISNVEISFNNGVFNGQSETVKFPALCNGSYSISGNRIIFDNACAWTAEFDWSLILSGEWTFNLDNNELILNKVNGDKYVLTPQ